MVTTARSRNSIFILLRSLDPGGAQVAMMRLAEYWANDGQDVTVIVQSAEPPVIAVPPGVRLHMLGVPRSLLAFWPLLRLLRSERPDVLISSLLHTSLVSTVACLFVRRTRMIVVEHAPVRLLCALHGGWRYRFLPLLVRFVYPLADAVVGVSQGVVSELHDMVPRARHLRCIYNPVFDARIEALSRRAEDLVTPASWREDPTVPMVIGCGRLAVEKDFATLLDAFALLRGTMRARLLILGEGPLRAELETQAKALHLGDDLLMVGFVVNPFPSMRAADVLALSSRFEGFGIVLVEALACGTPVVSTDAPFGPREVTQDGRYGRLVQIGDAAGLAEALALTIKNKPDHAELRMRAASFSVQQSAQGYLRLFKEVASTPGSHDREH